MKHNILLLSMLMLVFSFVSCKKTHDDDGAKSRVVLFYMVAENNLVSVYNNDDIREILSAKSQLKDDEEIIIYNDNNTNPAIYSVTNRTKGNQLSEIKPEYQYAEDHNSCSGQSLAAFLSYVRQHHPAQSYAVVMWSHGNGWVPSTYPSDSQHFAHRRSFGVDNGQNSMSNYGSQMSVSEMHSAFKSFGETFDYIMFDCCFMQTIEMCYELRDVARYIIGSPAEIPSPGANYTTMVAALFSPAFARAIPDSYYNAYANDNLYGCLVSTVDCSQLDDLADATSAMTHTYGAKLLSASYDGVLNYFDYADCRSLTAMPDYYDMNGIFLSQLPEADYLSWKAAFDKAVPYSVHTKSWFSQFPSGEKMLEVDDAQYGGISMYLPLQKYASDSYSAENAFFVNGYWESQWSQVWR